MADAWPIQAPPGAFVVGGGSFNFGQNYTESIVKNLITGNFSSGISQLEMLAERLAALPLDVLKSFMDFIPGSVIEQFQDVATAVETILNWFGTLGRLLTMGDWQGFLDQITGTVGGTVTDFVNRLQHISFDGLINATGITGMIAQAQVQGLALMQTIINQILDILNGLVVTPINSAVSGIRDWWNELTGKTQHLTPTGTIAGTAISGAISEAATGLNSLRDAIGAGLGAIGTGLSNLSMQNQATQVAQIAAQAAAAAAAANAQLQKSQGQQNAAGGGLNYTTVFGGADGASLPAEFSGSNLKVRGNNGYAGLASGLADGTYYATLNKQFSTDDQSISVVLGDQGGSPTADGYYLFHSDSTFSAGAYLRTDNASAEIGSYTRSGASFSFSPFSSGVWTGTLGQGQIVEAHNVGTTWTLSIGGNTVVTTTSSAVTFGASRRYGGGIVMTKATVSNGWFQGTTTYDAFRLATLTISDYVNPAYVGSGAVIARTSTSAVTVSATTAVIPNNFYNTTQSSTPDITVDLATGKFTVSLDGWYLVKVGILTNVTAATNSQGKVSPVLYRNGSVSRVGLPTAFAQMNTAAGGNLSMPANGISDSFPVYLNAGDYVQSGYAIGSGSSTRQLTGDSAGTGTYMSITLINRSQL